MTAIDNVGVTEILPPEQGSGSFFPIGTTPVSYRFSDAAGNTAYCNFTVNIMIGRLQPHKVKMQYVHFELHTNYFLLP